MSSNPTALDGIRKASSIDHAPGAPSIVDSLLNAGWTTADALERAYQATSEGGDNYVAAVLFVLPFEVRLSSTWKRLQNGHDEPFVLFMPHLPLHSDQRANKLDLHANLPTIQIPRRTQVIMSHPVIGYEREFYPNYVNHLARGVNHGSPVARGLTGRPIQLQEYERRVARSLRDAASRWIENFIPRYAVACQDPHASVPKLLPCFFLMMRKGRIVLPLSAPERREPPKQGAASLPGSWKHMQNWMTRTHAPSPYERAVIEAVRFIEMGQPNLAVTLVVSVLEWCVDEFVQQRFLNPLKIALGDRPEIFWAVSGAVTDSELGHINWHVRRKRLLPAARIVLSESSKKELTWLLELRNDAVHDIVTPIDDADARRAVSVGLSVLAEILDPLRR